MNIDETGRYSETFETLSTFMFWNWESTFELWKMVDFDDHVDLYKRSSKGKLNNFRGANGWQVLHPAGREAEK